jgi:hypothetical protein
VAALQRPEGQRAYRALRNEELGVYRGLVRCLVMRLPVGTGDAHAALRRDRTATRLLEDAEYLLAVPPARREREVTIAATDPAVAAVQDAGVAGQRALYFDGTHDLRRAPGGPPVPACNANDTDDDEAGFIALVSAAQTARAPPTQAQAQSPAAVTIAAPHGGAVAAPAAGASLSAAALKQLQAHRRTLETIERTTIEKAKLFVCSHDPSERERLRRDLEKARHEAVELEAKIRSLRG